MINTKSIAIYLPQFHQIPENDAAWGSGFTEWTNVKKASPFFDGHYQPHVPHESIGYYDLSNSEVLEKQAFLAKEFGIYGFAFYHYWFNGKRLLNMPVDNMLKSGKPDFPFCLIWANENWTKRWDGMESEIIQKQVYSHEDDFDHICFLCKNVFSDKRYILINNKPVFLVYRTELFPDIKKTVTIWRNEAKRYGFEDLYLIRVENFVKDINPFDIGFDAAMEFAPDMKNIGTQKRVINNNSDCYTADYGNAVIRTLLKKIPDYEWYRCVFPGWDNTPRRKSGGLAITNSSPEVFKIYLNKIIEYTRNRFGNENQFFFINAWNEWGEGCHLEPDLRNGTSYLEQLKEVLIYGISNSLDYQKFLEVSLIEKIKEIQIMQEANNSMDLIIKTRAFKFCLIVLKLNPVYQRIKRHLFRPYRFIKRLLTKKSKIGN